MNDCEISWGTAPYRHGTLRPGPVSGSPSLDSATDRWHQAEGRHGARIDVDVSMTTDRDRGPVTLATLVGRQRGMPAERTLTLVTSAARALDLLHARGRIHGAISPASFLVQSNGRVLLREAGPMPEDAGDADEARTYWSPQRLAGEPARRSDDLYALSLVALTLFVGDLSTEDRPAGTRMAMPSHDDPEHAAALSRIDTALRAQLGWSPSGRPASGAEIVREIARALTASDNFGSATQHAPPHTDRRSQWTAPAETVRRPARPEDVAPASPRGTPAPHLTPPSAARRRVHTSDPLDMPLAGKWVTAIAIILCSVYLLPLYYMVFQAR